jgi:hypothetical protein
MHDRRHRALSKLAFAKRRKMRFSLLVFIPCLRIEEKRALRAARRTAQKVGGNSAFFPDEL